MNMMIPLYANLVTNQDKDYTIKDVPDIYRPDVEKYIRMKAERAPEEPETPEEKDQAATKSGSIYVEPHSIVLKATDVIAGTTFNIDIEELLNSEFEIINPEYYIIRYDKLYPNFQNMNVSVETKDGKAIVSIKSDISYEITTANARIDIGVSSDNFEDLKVTIYVYTKIE